MTPERFTETEDAAREGGMLLSVAELRDEAKDLRRCECFVSAIVYEMLADRLYREREVIGTGRLTRMVGGEPLCGARSTDCPSVYCTIRGQHDARPHSWASSPTADPAPLSDGAVG